MDRYPDRAAQVKFCQMLLRSDRIVSAGVLIQRFGLESNPTTSANNERQPGQIDVKIDRKLRRSLPR